MANYIETTPPGAWVPAGASLRIVCDDAINSIDISSLSIPDGTLCRLWLMASDVNCVLMRGGGGGGVGTYIPRYGNQPLQIDAFAEDVSSLTEYGPTNDVIALTVFTFKANA